jgi:hypothetical protein
MAVKDAKKGPGAPKNTKPVVEEEHFSPLSVAGIRSGAVQSKVVKGVIVLAGAIMAGGLILTGLNPTTPTGNPSGRSGTGTAAVVGGQSITYDQLSNALDMQQRQMAQYGMKTGVTDYLQTKYSALQQLTNTAANLEAAPKEGVTVSDEDVQKKVDEEIDKYLKPQPGVTEAAFRREVEQQFGSMDKAREDLKGKIDREAVRKQVTLDKLEKQIKDANKVTEDDYKRSVTKLKLWQIVIQPKLASFGSKDYAQQTEKNKADAKARATKIYEQLKAKSTLANFQAVAKKESDDTATKAKGGDFGWKLPSELYYAPGMGDAISKVASNLVPPMFNDSGAAYIFFIESRKTDLPKDFAKNKKKLIADYETQKDNEAWSNKQTEYQKAVTPDIYDPALGAYEIQSQEVPKASGDEQKKLREDAISRYQEAVGKAGGMEKAAIEFQLASLYKDSGDKAKNLELLKSAAADALSDANVHLEYARALREAGKTKEAVAELKNVSKMVEQNPSTPTMFGNPDDMLHQQIASEFDLNKESKLAAAERKKVKPAPGGGMGGLGGNPNIQISPTR